MRHGPTHGHEGGIDRFIVSRRDIRRAEGHVVVVVGRCRCRRSGRSSVPDNPRIIRLYLIEPAAGEKNPVINVAFWLSIFVILYDLLLLVTSLALLSSFRVCLRTGESRHQRMVCFVLCWSRQ